MHKSIREVYDELLHDKEYMSDLACDMLSAEDGNEDPSQEQVNEAKQRAISTGYLMDIAKDHYSMQF